MNDRRLVVNVKARTYRTLSTTLPEHFPTDSILDTLCRYWESRQAAQLEHSLQETHSAHFISQLEMIIPCQIE